MSCLNFFLSLIGVPEGSAFRSAGTCYFVELISHSHHPCLHFQINLCPFHKFVPVSYRTQLMDFGIEESRSEFDG